ncbi:hypothetical protein [Oxynema aestuarii]|jgi:hypothetical protein|uniref:Uncharacterized protein n=1 Tax=Oxynema aestuarii AP17 TaxID=2064643 RepID=A0A6H1TVR1_9CYAN|nr:hypothetical protein [Oxynema aestuarii]QIZ69843.1 hypothetical protein HCG48_03990 [Oxynema aestuarii AP17]
MKLILTPIAIAVMFCPRAIAIPLDLEREREHFDPEPISIQPLRIGQATPPPDSTPSSSPGSLHRKQGNEQRFQPQRVPFRPRPNQGKPSAAASPGITIMNPSGYGASWGTLGIGLGLQERTRFTEDADGVMGIGMGFGDPRKNVGVALGVTVTDLWGDAFEDGTLSIKLHRRLPADFSVAAGVQGAVRWGETDGGSSVYGVVSRRFALQEDPSKPLSQLFLSVGVGGGQYRTEDQIDDGVDTVGLFGSAALRLYEPVNAVVEWTGQDLTVGLSIAPFRNVPIVISPALTDITGSAGDGTRFILGIGYGFSFDRF